MWTFLFGLAKPCVTLGPEWEAKSRALGALRYGPYWVPVQAFIEVSSAEYLRCAFQ
jgi:hypothetical protein